MLTLLVSKNESQRYQNLKLVNQILSKHHNDNGLNIIYKQMQSNTRIPISTFIYFPIDGVIHNRWQNV